MPIDEMFDVVVVGGGPSGATAAQELAQKGRKVLLLDRAGRIKPCGGAIPPRAIRDFAIPDSLLCAKISAARMISPTDKGVDMPIDNGGFVGMVDRDVFDEYLRERAVKAGAERRAGTFETFGRDTDGTAVIEYADKRAAGDQRRRVRARYVIGADGANSQIARQAVPQAGRVPFVFAYHEIVRMPEGGTPSVSPARCDVFYQGKVSPDFYGWVFPHGKTMSIGTGSAHKGFSLRGAVSDLRQALGIDGAETIRREGAPLPLYPAKRWDNGKDVVLAGDAAGLVAPASGEGIYYAMLGGQLCAQAVESALVTGKARELKTARKCFMKEHGRVFFILRLMQSIWYKNDKRRESFVDLCRDKDVQRLTWEAYMNKKLVKREKAAHARVFFKDLANLLGFAKA